MVCTAQLGALVKKLCKVRGTQASNDHFVCRRCVRNDFFDNNHHFFLCSALGADVIPGHPIWAITMLLGFATACFGILAALAGSGRLEIPTVICSVLCLLVWIAHGVAA